MRIELDNVIPDPIRERAELESEIWGTQTVFDSPGFYQVWAPSGRGKTTFTHIIYGLRRDYTGCLTIQGKRAADLLADDWARLRQRHFSIVFQDLRLFPYLTDCSIIAATRCRLASGSELQSCGRWPSRLSGCCWTSLSATSIRITSTKSAD